MPAIQKRVELGTIMEQKGFEVGVEVGVQRGHNAKEILTRWKSCKKFGMVDLWAVQENYNDAANKVDHDAYMNEAKDMLVEFKDKTDFYRMKSIEAPFANNSVDFIYLDARHDFCAVKEDLEYYWPKLRPGGIIAGHDFIYSDEMPETEAQDWSLCSDGSRQPGAVRGAVEELAKREGVVISVTYNDPGHRVFQTWIMQKPTIRECVNK